MANYRSLIASCLLCSVFASEARGQEADIGTAPWDYRDSRYAWDLATVETHHFNMDVQMLTRGQSGSFPGPDLLFIFNFFPNHHGALNAMGRLWRKSRGQPGGIPRGLTVDQTADYFFRRAMEFAPDDGVVRMLYGIHFFLDGDLEKARGEYEAALALEPNSPEIHYNAGLYFHAIGEVDVALHHANFAYQAGYPLPGLRNKLIESGVWNAAVQ